MRHPLVEFRWKDGNYMSYDHYKRTKRLSQVRWFCQFGAVELQNVLQPKSSLLFRCTWLEGEERHCRFLEWSLPDHNLFAFYDCHEARGFVCGFNHSAAFDLTVATNQNTQEVNNERFLISTRHNNRQTVATDIFHMQRNRILV